MANSTLTLNALLNLSYGAFTGGAEAQKALQEMLRRSIVQGAKRGSREAGEDAAKSWQKPYEALFKAGMKKQAEALKREAEGRFRTEGELRRKNKLLAQEERNTQDVARKQEIAAERKRIKDQIEQEKKARSRLEDMATKRAQERLRLIEEHEERSNRTSAEKNKERGEALQNAINGAFSADSLDLSSITETLGKGLAGGLGNLAGALGAAGGAGGGAFAALASAAAGLAAVIGPLAALAGVLAMAYSQTKELNKEILDTSSAFDLGGSAAEGFKKSLERIRGEVIDSALDMRLAREETMAAANALAQAGITFREFKDISRGAKDEFEGFQDVLRSSLSAAYGLGLEVSEVAEYYNKMSRDLGYNLDQIEGSFGLISEQAQLAGMRTKDFFGAINEASTGMALYNFRVGDTATLLTELVKILGEDLAKQKLGMEGTFKSMSMQDKYKQTLLGGSKFSGAVKADMRAQAKEFGASLKGTAGEEGLKKSGIMGEGGAIDTKALANMSGKAFREALESSGLNDTQKRQLQTLKTLSQAEKGGMGVAAASGALSRRGELAAQMAQGSAMFGGKLLSELSGVQRMMAEEVTGRSGEEYDVLARVQEQMTAQFEQMKRNNDPKVMGKTFEEAVTEGLLTAAEEDVSKLTNKKHFTEVEKAAREQLKESRSISQTITNVIQKVLERIAVGLELLTSILAPEDDKRAKESSDSIARQESLVKSIDALDTAISEKKFQMEETTDPAERAKLKGEIDAAKMQRDAQKKSLEEEEKIQRGIARGKTAGEVRSGLMKEQYGSQMEALTPEKLKAAGLGDLVRITSGRQTGETETLNLESLSEEQKEILQKMFTEEKAAAEAQAAALEQEGINQSIRDMDASKQSKKEHEETIKTLQIMDKASATQQLASYLGLNKTETEAAIAGSADALGKIRSMLEEGEGGFTEAEKLLVSRSMFDLGATAMDPPAEDFVYRGDGVRGTITPIDTADEFYGAKPDGAIDRAIRGAGGKAVNIYIQGGDEARVYSVVKKVLLETGYPGMKSY